MLSFFKKNNDKKPQLEGKESVVPSEEILSEKQEGAGTPNGEEIHTELSFHPSWNLTKEDIYSFQFLNNECPPLQARQLSLSGITIIPTGDDYQVTAFVRSSLDKAISLGEATLVLLDANEKIIGRKNFQLSELGELPPRCSRPWSFIFTKKDLFHENIPATGWKLAFQLHIAVPETHRLDLAESWKKALAQNEKQKLKEIVEKLAPPKEGEVNFLGLQAKVSKDADLHVTMLIRNGSKKEIRLEKIPLIVEDAVGDIVAEGGFTLEDFRVKANTTKPWTFIFPKAVVKKASPDFSRWKAYAPQEK